MQRANLPNPLSLLAHASRPQRFLRPWDYATTSDPSSTRRHSAIASALFPTELLANRRRHSFRPRRCRGPLSRRRFEIHTQASTVPSPFCFERTPSLEAENCQEEETTPKSAKPRPRPETHDSSTTGPSLWDFIAGSWAPPFDAKPHSCALYFFLFPSLVFSSQEGIPILSRPPVISPGDSSTFPRCWPCRGLSEQRPQRAHDNGRCVPNYDDLDTTFLLPRRDGVLVGHVGSPRGMVPAPSPPSFPRPPSALQAPPTCTSISDPASASRPRTQVVQNMRG